MSESATIKGAKAPKKRRTATAGIVPTVDFPRDGEEIAPGCYAIRVSCSAETREMEVSVDGGPWSACRAAVGYWWHDYPGGEAGAHRVTARVRDGEGRLSVSSERVFAVRR